MKKLVPTLCAVLALSPLARAGEVFENPLEDQDFVYSEKNIRESIEEAEATKPARVEHTFSNATGEALGRPFSRALPGIQLRLIEDAASRWSWEDAFSGRQ